jgi:UDP-N-acetylglucosamine enolpyruvyl transferase
VTISGAKNAALPILFAALLASTWTEPLRSTRAPSRLSSFMVVSMSRSFGTF